MSTDAQHSTRQLWKLLPAEIQEKIIDDVEHCHPWRSGDPKRGYVLSRVAPISRHWQQLVERRTFKTLTLTTKDFSTTTTEHILHSTERLGHVEILQVELCLVGQDILQACPLAKPSQGAPSPVASKAASDCPCPTCTVVALFKLLKPAPKWDRPYINLTINIEGHTERGPAVLQCFQLAQPEENLFCLPMVRRLKIPKSNYRVFMPDSACRIASRMTQLEIFSYEGTWGESEAVRFEVVPDEIIQRARNDFAKTLGQLPPTLRELEIDYTDWISSSDNFPPNDELSNALCTFSQRENLTKFSVAASLGLSIFDSSVRPYSQGLTWYFVVFKDEEFVYDDAGFFGQMAERGAAVGQRLSRDTSVRLYHVDHFFIYKSGKLYYCESSSGNQWEESVMTAWERTAMYHNFELVARLNKSPSDDESTDVSDDEPVCGFGGHPTGGFDDSS